MLKLCSHEKWRVYSDYEIHVWENKTCHVILTSKLLLAGNSSVFAVAFESEYGMNKKKKKKKGQTKAQVSVSNECLHNQNYIFKLRPCSTYSTEIMIAFFNSFWTSHFSRTFDCAEIVDDSQICEWIVLAEQYNVEYMRHSLLKYIQNSPLKWQGRDAMCLIETLLLFKHTETWKTILKSKASSPKLMEDLKTEFKCASSEVQKEIETICLKQTYWELRDTEGYLCLVKVKEQHEVKCFVSFVRWSKIWDMWVDTCKLVKPRENIKYRRAGNARKSECYYQIKIDPKDGSVSFI